MGYFEAYRERLNRNENELLELAQTVMKADENVEVYASNGTGKKSFIIFFLGEEINNAGFMEVPYGWVGCGYTHNNRHSGGENVSMPFTAEDVLKTFTPVTSLFYKQNIKFKSKEDYLKYYSFLTKLEKL